MHPRALLPLPSILVALVALLGGLLVAAAPASAADLSPAPAGEAVWPLTPVPEVVEGFDPPESRWGAGHRGVDLAGSPGQAVRAAVAGTVTFAGSLAGRGVVVVDHGTTRTTYEPVEATVRVGEAVGAGDRIGRIQTGDSHCAPATCLHWGLIAGEEYLDPLTLVGAGPVRLLPLDGVVAGSVAMAGAALPGSAAGGAFPRWARDTAPVALALGNAPLFRDR